MFQGYSIQRDDAKNEKLKKERGISFEDVVTAMKRKHILEIVPHHNQKKYPGQFEIVFHRQGYPYVCPVEVRPGKVLYMITIFANRKYKHLLS